MSERGPSLLDLIEDPALRSIAERGSVRTIPKNTVIISEGDHGDSFYVIITGRVKVFSASAQGKEVVLDIHGPGGYVGELALDSQPRSASVVTLERCVCAVVQRSALAQYIAENPDFAIRMITELIRRVRVATENVKSLALMDVYGRVARLLLSVTSDEDGQAVVKEKLTQQDIADRVGASREMVSRILKDLHEGGYISIVKRRITVNKKPPSGW